jgi:hypothetical protein
MRRVYRGSRYLGNGLLLLLLNGTSTVSAVWQRLIKLINNTTLCSKFPSSHLFTMLAIIVVA